ncbi:MAG: hypothetical protein LBE62_03075 [Azonexus sp.]|jgi:hypothetical protein|nr:hypothetical protein [Azonexus sp.]
MRRRLVEMVAAGANARQVAAAFGISTKAAQLRIRMDGDKPVADQFTRPCLCCGKKFRSVGHHNRLCPACRHDAQSVSPYAP